jgi:radical SAM superfamily enzyme YgiQ (UPF0313 family)
MRINLIAPSWSGPLPAEGRRARQPFPPLALPAVAALTPPEVEVTLTDEAVDQVQVCSDFDLVGITSMTASAPRAYEIADSYRAIGVPVVIGGMHATALPEEAAQHADAVVIGEAEGVWERLLNDAKNGCLGKFYQCEGRPSLAGLPVPRRDLLKRNAYISTALVQTSRGCPFDCSFCSVSRFFGQTYRFRPVQEVVDEVAGLRERILVFTDDNIFGNAKYARELFTRLAGLGKRWMGQASVTVARDAELVALAAKAGCRALFIGFETLSAEGLRGLSKRVNLSQQFHEVIRRLHDHGIGVIGSFMFGLDDDDESAFERTVDFVERHKIDVLQMSLLTPLPGTRLYESLEREGRIFDRDWSHYTGGRIVFEPRLISPDRIQELYDHALRHVYSLGSIFKRLSRWNIQWPLFARVNLIFRSRLIAYHRRHQPALARLGTAGGA